MGDVHPEGNPHYWLDPRNAGAVARDIAEGLARVDAARAKQADAAYERGVATVKNLPSRAIFTYHKSWSYLADAFGLEVVATVEPVPGINPTARHLEDLVQTAKARKVTVLLQEPYFSQDAGKFLARDANVRPITMSSACDDETPGSYLGHLQAVLVALAGGK
jgi:zinc/manganese transport system substrate-binding protein